MQLNGLEHIVLCPGSRSAPLALAAGKMSAAGLLKLTTAIDERSAAFLALGISTALGRAAAVVTTSGSAVANLLPAAVEADRSCQPLLLLTADRPQRLKDCGSNQTVNQEEFLLSVCRWFGEGPREGLHIISDQSLKNLINKAWRLAHHHPSGPVHLNLPLEEPLHASLTEQKEVLIASDLSSLVISQVPKKDETAIPKSELAKDLFFLDPFLPGVIVAGPWRGTATQLIPFQKALTEWQSLSGWPVLADPLSAVNQKQAGLISNWELLLPEGLPVPTQGLQVMRLGPMSSSRNLETWLQTCAKKQLLISEGDSRKLDPLGLSVQWSDGLNMWLKSQLINLPKLKNKNTIEGFDFAKEWIINDQVVDDFLDQKLLLEGALNEPALAYWLPRLLPEKLPIMISASTPIRDWISFAGSEPLSRRCFGFRGASGIDGTLSLGMGLSLSLGQTILVTGDLALLHDSNGWLFTDQKEPPLLVLLIDNGGGGIFQQLDIETSSKDKFNELFAMPQKVDQISLVKAHGIPSRQIACLDDLEGALEWGLSQTGPALLRVSTCPLNDVELRNELRNQIRMCLGDHVDIA